MGEEYEISASSILRDNFEGESLSLFEFLWKIKALPSA